MRKIIVLFFIVYSHLNSIECKKFHKAKKSLHKAKTSVSNKYNVQVEVNGLIGKLVFFSNINLQDSYYLFDNDGMPTDQHDEADIVGTTIRCYKPTEQCFLPYYFVDKCSIKPFENGRIEMKTPNTSFLKFLPKDQSAEVQFLFTLLNKDEKANVDLVIKDWRNACINAFKLYNEKRKELIDMYNLYMEKQKKYNQMKGELESVQGETINSFRKHKANIIKASKKVGLSEAIENLEKEIYTANDVLELFKQHLYINGNMDFYNSYVV